MPDDLKHFKTLTKGHTIIMGRKTWESIGAKPLPHRPHIIITRNADYKAEGAIVVTSIEDALKAIDPTDEQPFIVGGAEAAGFADCFQLQIFNRWGSEVFKTQNPQDCWQDQSVQQVFIFTCLKLANNNTTGSLPCFKFYICAPELKILPVISSTY